MLSVTIDEVVVATNATPDGVDGGGNQGRPDQRALSGEYWTVAETGGAGRPALHRRFAVAGGRAAGHSARPAARLRAAHGTIISYNDPGLLRPPLRQPLRVAASLKSLPGRDQPRGLHGRDRPVQHRHDTRQFATFTWIALLIARRRVW